VIVPPPWADPQPDRRAVHVRGVTVHVQKDAPGLCDGCDEPVELHTVAELHACAAERLGSRA
jgi:hypothetical protein